MVSLASPRSGERAGLPSPLPEFKPLTLKDAQRALIERGIPPQGSESVITNLSGTDFRNRLEKHVDDYESGHGYRSRATANALVERHSLTGSTLNQTDPGSGSMYAGYATSFGYSSSARFKTGVYESAEKVQMLQAVLAGRAPEPGFRVTV